MQPDSMDDNFQDRKDAYQDIKTTLKATRTIAMAMNESPIRTQLIESLDLANNLLEIHGGAEFPEYPPAIALPAEILRLPISTLKKFHESPTEEEMRRQAEALRNWVEEGVKWLMARAETLDPSEFRTHLRGELQTLSLNLSVSRTLSGLDNITKNLKDKSEQFDETIDIAQDTNTEIGARELSKEFSALADSQASTARLWTIVAMTLLATTAIAAYLLLQLPNEGTSFAYFGRLAVTLPLAGAAVYAARISGHYRETAQWAHATAVQLSTIRAYSDSLSVESKNALRYELGVRAFGAPGRTVEVAVPPSALEEPLGLLERATALLKSKPGNSSTE